MKIHIREGDIHLFDVQTRMPFQYGIATMTSTPHLFLRLRVEVDGKPATGVSADHLPPKWFTKDAARPITEETHEMLAVIENALRLAVGTRAESPFDAWLAVHGAQSAWGRAQGLPPLLTQFGTSLVERALIEAVCRATERPFHEMLRDNLLGIRLDAIHPSLAGRATAEVLPLTPRSVITVRHTIGLADPLTDDELAPDERLDDGLPHSLAACIRTYRLRHFKIKLSGDSDRDTERLRRIAAVLAAHAPDGLAFSLDGNEQFRSVAGFHRFWDHLGRAPDLAQFLRHLLFVEQPVHRSVALDPILALRDWVDRPPIIIDESDVELDSLPRALELGYAGTSHKNCKGTFKSIANAALLWQRYEQQPGRRPLMSGEDLANIGPVALLQDLTVCAALRIPTVERNGHHYFAGLSMFPSEVQQQVLRHHGDLYHASRDGWPTLQIQDGTVNIGSLLQAPFGVGFAMPVDGFRTPDQWRRANPRVPVT
jgi:hypothetical protein